MIMDDSTKAAPPQQQPQAGQAPLCLPAKLHSLDATTFFLERTFFRVGISSLVILGLSYLSAERGKT